MIEGELSLSTHLSILKGIGPKRFDAFSSIGLNTIEDILHYYPRKYLDRTTISSLSKLKTDEEITVIGAIQAAELKKAREAEFAKRKKAVSLAKKANAAALKAPQHRTKPRWNSEQQLR